MALSRYSESQRNEFIATAKEIGISPAMRRLGYPGSYATAVRFFKETGQERPHIDSLMQQAAEMRVMYGDNEKMFGLMAAFDRITEQFLEKDDLDAEAINKLANALAKIVASMQLIQGKPTTINESRQQDEVNLKIQDEISKIKAQNALRNGA